MFNPRELRHRVNIDEKSSVQDRTTGAVKEVWKRVWSDVPAKISPVSVREFMSSHAVQSGVTARITIRYREGLKASMRIEHKGRIYNPEGWLQDPDSGIHYVTAPCTEGLNNG